MSEMPSNVPEQFNNTPPAIKTYAPKTSQETTFGEFINYPEAKIEKWFMGGEYKQLYFDNQEKINLVHEISGIKKKISENKLEKNDFSGQNESLPRGLKNFTPYELEKLGASKITGIGKFEIVPVSNNGSEDETFYKIDTRLSDPEVRENSRKWFGGITDEEYERITRTGSIILDGNGKIRTLRIGPVLFELSPEK